MAEFNEPLTERELEVVRLVATGLTNKEVAAKLFLSPSTIKVHLNNIFTKLDVHTRSGLTMLAIRSGWVEGAAHAETAQPAAVTETAPEALEVTSVESVADSAEERAAPVVDRPAQPVPLPVVPLRVAPNPSPLQRTPMWRKLAILAATAGAVALALVPAPAGGIPTLQTDGTELASNVAGDGLVAGETTRWSPRAPLSVARARAASAALGGRIFLIGGEANQAATGDVAIFTNKTNSWQGGPQKPTPVWNAAAAVQGQNIYVSGGNTANGTQSNRVEVLDTAGNVWRAVAPMPKALAGHTMVESEGRLYVFGGRAVDGNNATVFAFDTALGTWSAMATMQSPRSLAAAVAVRGRIYVVGGFDEGRESALCEIFSVASATWSRCADMLLPRGSFGLVRVANTLYAIGGGRAGYVGFNERYDLTTNRWSTFETPITGDWHSVAVASDGGELYVIGGYSGGRRLPTTYLYEAQQTQTYLPAVTSQGEPQR